ncbi:MAG: NADAR family protein [Methylotenera sp.]
MLFPNLDEDALFLSRSDESEVLGTHAIQPFTLDGKEWLTVEHYFQAMKFETTSPDYYEKIRMAPDAKKAKKLGATRLKKLRPDWKKVRRVVMTRAVYTRCHAHEASKTALLDTKDCKIMENSQYDYFWGCGRDRRGENTYGLILMDVRQKLVEEAKNSA